MSHRCLSRKLRKPTPHGDPQQREIAPYERAHDGVLRPRAWRRRTTTRSEPRRAGRTPPPATAASRSAASSGSQPYAGQSLTVETYTAVPEFDFYKSLLPKFEAQTGIHVNWVEQPVDTMDSKIPLQLKAKDTGLDVFFTGSENITSYIGSNGVQPYDSYISNPKDTPASWNWARRTTIPRHAVALPSIFTSRS